MPASTASKSCDSARAPAVPVILLTAKGSTSDKAKGLTSERTTMWRSRSIWTSWQPGSGRCCAGPWAWRRAVAWCASTTSRSTWSGAWSPQRRARSAVTDRVAAASAPGYQRGQGRAAHGAADQGLGARVPRRPAVPAGLGQSRPAKARLQARRAGPDQDVPGDRIPARRRRLQNRQRSLRTAFTHRATAPALSRNETSGPGRGTQAACFSRRRPVTGVSAYCSVRHFA